MIREIMPWKGSSAGDITLLTAPGRRLTKTLTPDVIHPYDKAKLFRVEARRLDGVEDFERLLHDLAGAPNTCVIRAALKDPIESFAEIRCWIHDRAGVPARFREVPRSWVMLDLEPAAAPPCVAPADPEIAGGFLRKLLPPPFQMARCVVQLSSSAGLKPGLRAHLWFWLDRALAREELERLLDGVPGLDLATLRPRQLHYTASPVFLGRDDPIHERICILPGLAEVEVGELPPPPRTRQAFTPSGAGRVGAAGAERYAQACLRRLALAPEGRRHPTCMAVSCRLLAIAKAGQLDPIRVGSMIIGVALGRGLERPEIDSILQWAWQQVEPESLPR